MLKRYDIVKDEMVELTQEWIDEQGRYATALALHYKEHAPESFKKFYDNFIFKDKVN